MAQYSTEESETNKEKFVCGYSQKDSDLYELSDAEPDNDHDEVHVKFAEAPEDVEDFEAKHSTQSPHQQAQHQASKVVQHKPGLLKRLLTFIEDHWFKVLLLIVFGVATYYWYTGQLSWPVFGDSTFSLADSQAFVGSSSSLGRNVVATMRHT